MDRDDMTHRPFYPAGHESITEDLQQFRVDCGEPGYSGIKDTIERLSELFPIKHGRPSLPETLSRSAISQFFTGAKSTVPSAGMLAVLVLSHLRCAAENGSIRVDPETGAPQEWESILEAWQARRRRAKHRPDPPLPEHGARQDTDIAAAGASGPEPDIGCSSEHGDPAIGQTDTEQIRDVRRIPADARIVAADAASTPNPPPRTNRLSVMPSVSWTVPPGTARNADPVHLTSDQFDALVAHGSYGHVLAEYAGVGDPEAIYQLAVILALDPRHRASAQALLVSATAARHPAAVALVPGPGRSIDLHDARARANELARRAEECGHEAAMQVFLSCVQQAGLRAMPIAMEDEEAR